MRTFGRVLAEEDFLDPGGIGEPLKDSEWKEACSDVCWETSVAQCSLEEIRST